MPLTIATRLGPYEITGALGAGGMGEVYRAHDTKLDRQVAIKILPELFASDAGRLARFEREAKTLAALNHPNIAQIHGLEDSGPLRGLVLELVEGEDLAARRTWPHRRQRNSPDRAAECKVPGSRCKVQRAGQGAGARCRVHGSECKVQGATCKAARSRRRGSR